MSMTEEQLTSEAMQLPASSRAELSGNLIESLDFTEGNVTRVAWVAQAIRRRDDVRPGRVLSIPNERNA